MSLSQPRAEAQRDEPTMRYSRHRPQHGITSVPNPLSGFRSLPEFHPYVTACQSVIVSRRSRWLAPSEVSSPSASLSHEEPHTPGGTHPDGYVAPSGFRTLSTPCSPHGLPGLFHPGTAHGVSPFEALFLTWCRTPSRTPRPSGVSPRWITRPPLQGLSHQAKLVHRSGYSPDGCAVCLPGLSRFEAS
jgi:hypothetical protein